MTIFNSYLDSVGGQIAPGDNDYHRYTYNVVGANLNLDIKVAGKPIPTITIDNLRVAIRIETG